jgi:hypothetical protein
VSEADESGKNFEKLSKAITEAVMTSPKVKQVISEIQEDEEICPKSFMVLVLKMEVLTDTLELEVEEELIDESLIEEPPAPKKRRRKKSSKKPQFIDGQELSKKEIEFQEFSNNNFDADEWLKKNGLIF